jgi:hypothetical protein
VSAARPSVPTVLPGYQVEPDRLPSSSASPELFRFLCLDPRPSRGEGLYVRRVRRADGASCVQAILFYRVQWLPYHLHDYAPFYLYFDPPGRLAEIVYDAGHHRAARLSPGQADRLTVSAPWHALRPGRTPLAVKLRAAEFPLDDDTIRHWWYQKRSQAQLKLRSKLVDPWLPGLRPDGGAPGTFRDEAPCPRCGVVTPLGAMEIDGVDLLRRMRCPAGHPFVAAYRARSGAVEAAHP